MHKLIKKVLKMGTLFVFYTLALTACTGREDIVLESYGSANMPESGGIPETEDDMPTNDEENCVQTPEVQPDAALSKIYVHICGAVVNPGVYELAEGSRVFEGIEAAGGFSEDAYEDYVNQAGCLKDGERLAIPTEEEIETEKAAGTYKELWQAADAGIPAAGAGGNGASGNENGLVNINTATESELGGISGIGAGKAAAIVQYRQENGNFASVEDIMKVSGIKEGTYEKIKDKITVN